ncbi:Protein N-acetyltransferase, RimJ/RimL family [Micromonospora citrea]|uniref:Protein N-acetyltransferase, RimJ/RimL family n=1 Tax=Micromonospora citrea TaxID=47855 RepID=A0A1C6VV70_9ACTN|nr:GNAT family N-acetyltransferase [Micromonospora citrea]SCL70087.1 Protein N-acetyltransferase, RimJ/RimL family [Micromonospora citrea]
MGDKRADDVELRTERLSLRRPLPADVDAIYRVHHDPEACAHNPADLLATRADAEDLYRRWDRHWRQHGFGYRVVQPRAADERHLVLGFCGLKLMRLHGREVLNLFYRLDPAAWGNGVATEAATAVVDWAATHLPGRPLVARVRPANVASARVAARAGLRRAPGLDTEGEDGLDWIYTRNWPGGPVGPPGQPVTSPPPR